MLHDVIQAVLAEVEDARCVVLASTDGIVVASAVAPEGPAPDVVAASLADLFRRVSATHRDAGLAPPDEFTTMGGEDGAAVRQVASQYVLMAVLKGAEGLGRARFAMLKAAEALEREL